MSTPTLMRACAIAAGVVLVSCATIDKPIPLPEGRWEMTTSSFVEGGRMPGLPRATLQIRNGRIAVYGGCNSANSTVSSVDGKMVVPALAATRRACPEPAGSFEGRYFRLLGNRPYFRIENGVLILAAGDDSMQFRAIPEKPAAAKPQP